MTEDKEPEGLTFAQTAFLAGFMLGLLIAALAVIFWLRNG